MMIQNNQFEDSDSDGFRPSSDASNSHQKYTEQNEASSNRNYRDSSSDKSQVSEIQNDSEVSESDISEEDHLKRDILKQVVEKQKRMSSFQEGLTSELFEKLSELEEAANQKVGEELVTLRIQEMVLVKVLVMSYGRSEYRLILAHFHLGEAYLRHQCIDQAIQHISLAIHKNEKLFHQFPKTQLLHSYMQNVLAQCLIQKEQYDDAIQILKKSIQIQQQIKEKQKSNSKTRILLAKCYCQQKEFEEAIHVIDEVYQIVKGSGRGKEEQAFVLVEKALILAAKDDFKSAVVAQDEAINILIKINYPRTEQVAEMYTKLAEYFEKLGNPESTLVCIQKVKTLYQQLFSPEDKRVIKARRKIVTSLLKSERFKEAINQLLQVVELEEKVYGESSLQTAKSLKLLGSVYISLEKGEARTYLKRAMNIYQSHGNKKQVQQVKQKLKILINKGSNTNDAKILSEQDL